MVLDNSSLSYGYGGIVGFRCQVSGVRLKQVSGFRCQGTEVQSLEIEKFPL